MASIGSAVIYFMPYNIPLIVLFWSMLMDTVEYTEWKTVKRAKGIIFVTYSFVQKLAIAAAGGALGIDLSF